MFSQIKMYLAQVHLEQDRQSLLFFLICKMCGALEDIRKRLWEGQKMPSADKMHCSHLINWRGDIRPVDAIFFPENKCDYLYTLCCAEQHADKQQRKRSLCLPLWSPHQLPHFRSAPQQMQTSYDTYCWAAAIPLA